MEQFPPSQIDHLSTISLLSLAVQFFSIHYYQLGGGGGERGEIGQCHADNTHKIMAVIVLLAGLIVITGLVSSMQKFGKGCSWQDS